MRKRKAASVVEVLVVCAIILVLLGVVCAIVGETISTSHEKETAVGLSATLRTIEHDGHKFVALTKASGGAAILHHPDCPCRNMNEVTTK